MRKPLQAAPVQAAPGLQRQAAAAMARCATWNTRLAGRRLTQFLEHRLAPTGLTTAQFGLLGLVAAATDESLGAMAERAGLDQSSLSRGLDALAKAGWVEMAAMDGDRRRRAAWLTAAGTHRLTVALPAWEAAQAEIDAILDAGLVQRLAEAVQRLEP
jgi:DNA-binding MarR family transcriptional regulator